MNDAKIILKNTQHKNILYFMGYLAGHGFGFIQEILVLHITAIIMNRHVFAFLLTPLIKITQYFQFTANEGLFS